MQSANNNSEISFQEAMDDPYYKNILYQVCNKNLRSVCNEEEIRSLAMSTLWNCLQKYRSNNPTKAEFTSYLYRAIENNSRRLYKKKIRTAIKEKQLLDHQHGLTFDYKIADEVRDILLSVRDKDEESYNILIQKYFQGMTNREIGRAAKSEMHPLGYSKEAARKKLKKALNLCREIVYI